MLAQQVVEHPEELEDPLLPPGVRQPRVVDHQVGVDLPVVPADVQPPGEQVQMGETINIKIAIIVTITSNLTHLAAAPCLLTISTLGMKRWMQT